MENSSKQTKKFHIYLYIKHLNKDGKGVLRLANCVSQSPYGSISDVFRVFVGAYRASHSGDIAVGGTERGHI